MMVRTLNQHKGHKGHKEREPSSRNFCVLGVLCVLGVPSAVDPA
jgi:hypothetical protein